MTNIQTWRTAAKGKIVLEVLSITKNPMLKVVWVGERYSATAGTKDWVQVHLTDIAVMGRKTMVTSANIFIKRAS